MNKRKLYIYWLKAQWVNETCRNLQKAKVIKIAAFCHNRALQDLYPDSYRFLFTTGSFTSTASPLSNDLTFSAFNVRTCWKDRILLVPVEYDILVCRGALELYYSRIAYFILDCD